MRRLLCLLQGHRLVPFASRNFGGAAGEIPSWLFECERCGALRSGRLFAPAPWPPPPAVLLRAYPPQTELATAPAAIAPAAPPDAAPGFPSSGGFRLARAGVPCAACQGSGRQCDEKELQP